MSSAVILVSRLCYRSCISHPSSLGSGWSTIRNSSRLPFSRFRPSLLLKRRLHAFLPAGSGQGRWLTPQQAEAINAEAKRKEAKSNPQANPSDWPSLSNAPDDEMAAAIAASLQDAGPSTSGADSQLGGGSSHWGGASSHLGGADSQWGEDEDPELAAAIAASLNESTAERKEKPREAREAGGPDAAWSGKGQKLGGSGAPEGDTPSVQSGGNTKPTSFSSQGGVVPQARSMETEKPKFEMKQDALSRQIAAARAKVEAQAAANATTTSQTGGSANASRSDTGPSSRPGDTVGGGVELAFRLLDGRRVSRTFAPGATVGDLLTYLCAEGVDTDTTVLTAGGGEKLSLADSQIALDEAGFKDKCLITIRKS